MKNKLIRGLALCLLLSVLHAAAFAEEPRGDLSQRFGEVATIERDGKTLRVKNRLTTVLFAAVDPEAEGADSVLFVALALVDADLRRSQISSRYGMQITEGQGQGLAHFLANMCPLANVVFETDVRGAYMIPAGKEVPNSLALLSVPRFSQMIRQLQTQFDYVIVDAPPIGVIIDAAEIAKCCDGTIFAVKYNSISRKELQDAKNQIARTGCPILGAVLNDVAFDSLSSKKYYNKHYYSHYDSDYYKPGAGGKKSSRAKR